MDDQARRLFRDLDHFLQWDLVTATPWGAPSISPVGARLVEREATLWTSTTVGYASKVRNIRHSSRVCLLRAHPGKPAVLVRGEARVIGGDGTLNLTHLFQLMDGPGGARRFFATSVSDPHWSWLYRAYWRRFLIAVRVVDISVLGPEGWEPHQVGRWSRARSQRPPPPRRSRPRGQALLDARGRALLTSDLPAALAFIPDGGDCPWAGPVRAAPAGGGAISVESDWSLPALRLPRSALAVRVLDDTFEVARMSGWIGTLEAGVGVRRFVPRSSYGFVKPPGVVGDLAAALAAGARSLGASGRPRVSLPDVGRAARLGGTGLAGRLELSEELWRTLRHFFARRNAAAVWYSGAATLSRGRREADELRLLAERAQLERDWAQGLLIQGQRRVGTAQLAAGVVALGLNPVAPLEAARREEAALDRVREQLSRQLPQDLGPPSGPGARPDPAAPRSRTAVIRDVGLAAAVAAAAAADRWRSGSDG